jgi:hypothetical protein
VILNITFMRAIIDRNPLLRTPPSTETRQYTSFERALAVTLGQPATLKTCPPTPIPVSPEPNFCYPGRDGLRLVNHS